MKKYGFKTTIKVYPGERWDFKKFKEMFSEWVKIASAGVYVIEIKKELTPEQRGYFHAVVAPHFKNIQDELGVAMTIPEAKELLKKKFIGTRIMKVALGDGEEYEIKYLPSTESLSKHEYMNFIQDCLNWFVDQFGMPAPEARR